MEKKSILYKLIVTSELEEKIRYFLRKYPSTEYSGTLFYKVEGTFEANDLVVTGVDFLLQDIGTSGYTEFDQSPDVIGYMVDHPELLNDNIHQGLMHSHHTMGAFFSGTDVSTLREEGNDRAHFVSLIIDTRGTYAAAITRVVEEEVTVTGRIKYSTFGNKLIQSPVSYTYTKKKMEWFNLTVERPEIIHPYQELDDRIAEVLKQKAAKPVATPYASSSSYKGGYNQYTGKEYVQPSVITPSMGISYQTNVGKANMAEPKPVYNPNYVPPVIQRELPFESDESDSDIPPAYGVLHANPILIESAAKQIMCGTVAIIDGNKIDLNKFARGMKSIYDSRFPTFRNFEDWASQHVEFIIYDIDDEELIGLDIETEAAIVAYDLVEVFKTLPKNEYTTCFINLLEHYLI